MRWTAIWKPWPRRSELQASDPRFSILHANFAELREALASLGISKVNGVLLDLGVSSPQIDNPARGFSFRFDAPLDMRMDTIPRRECRRFSGAC